MERDPERRRQHAAHGAAASLTPLAALIVVALLLLLPGPAFAKPQQTKSPRVDAAAWVLIDARDGTELAGKAESETRPIASTTKLMTAYLTLERFDLDKVIRAPEYNALPAESVLGLNTGERMSVGDLLTAMMLPSANDAADTLARGVAGSVPKFVARMNVAARELGLADTSYTTPIGLDDPGNGSSARDLATLARELMRDKRFRKIVSQTSATLETGDMPRTVETRNTLMYADPSVNGIKTGHTLGAGYVLVAAAERKGVPLISAVLGASSEAARDAASATLLDFGFSLYRERDAVERGEELGQIEVEDGEEETLALEAAKPFTVTARADQELTYELEAPAIAEAPVSGGQRLGKATVLLDGERVGAVPAVAAAGVIETDLIDEVGGPVAVVLIALGSILLVVALISVARRRDHA